MPGLEIQIARDLYCRQRAYGPVTEETLQGRPRSEPCGAARLLGSFHKDPAPRGRLISVRCRKDRWGPGLESGERGQLALKVTMRRADDGCEGIWTRINHRTLYILQDSASVSVWSFLILAPEWWGGDCNRHFHSLDPTCWQTFGGQVRLSPLCGQ